MKHSFSGYRQNFLFFIYFAFLGLLAFCFYSLKHYPPIEHIGHLIGLVFFILFFGFFTWVIVYSILHDLASYKVFQNGIMLCSPAHKNTFIPYREIASITWLSSEEITKFWHDYQVELIGAEVDLEIFSYFKLRKITKYLTRYSTIHPTYKTVAAGSERNIVSMKTFPVKGNFILIKTRSGRNYYITPKDPKGFMDAYQGYNATL